MTPDPAIGYWIFVAMMFAISLVILQSFIWNTEKKVEADLEMLRFRVYESETSGYRDNFEEEMNANFDREYRIASLYREYHQQNRFYLIIAFCYFTLVEFALLFFHFIHPKPPEMSKIPWLILAYIYSVWVFICYLYYRWWNKGHLFRVLSEI